MGVQQVTCQLDHPSTWVWTAHWEYRSCVVQSIVRVISKVTYKPSVCIWCWAPPLKHPPSIWHKMSIHTIRVHRPLLFHYFFLLQCITNKQNTQGGLGTRHCSVLPTNKTLEDGEQGTAVYYQQTKHWRTENKALQCITNKQNTGGLGTRLYLYLFCTWTLLYHISVSQYNISAIKLFLSKNWCTNVNILARLGGPTNQYIK